MVPPPEQDQGYHGRIRPTTRLSMETLQRTVSDIAWELRSNREVGGGGGSGSDGGDGCGVDEKLVSVPEAAAAAEDIAKCECCGLCEECTHEYIDRVRAEFSGRLICGLCSEAVNQEMEKNGGKREEAVNEHMNACISFNRLDRAYPVLCQAEAMREILKRSRAKSVSPRVTVVGGGGGGAKLGRSSSCMPAFTKDIKNREMVN